MAQITRKANKYKVVNSRNKLPVGAPNTFSTLAAARKRKSECSAEKGCKRRTSKKK